jgi:hypothetical protein
VGNCNLIFAGLAEKAEQYSIAILWVPTSGSGKMAGALLTINTISLANVNLGSYICILSKHTTKLTKDQLRSYLSWFFGAEDEQLATCRTPSNMVTCLVNLEATGNQSLVANRMVELCCKSVMLYHFLVNLLKTTEMTCNRMDIGIQLLKVHQTRFLQKSICSGKSHKITLAPELDSTPNLPGIQPCVWCTTEWHHTNTKWKSLLLVRMTQSHAMSNFCPFSACCLQDHVMTSTPSASLFSQ